MKRTFAVAAVAGLVALKLLGAAPASATTVSTFYTFGQGLKPWVAGAEDSKYISAGTLTQGFEYGPSLVPNGYAALANKSAHGVWMQAPAQNDGDTVDIAFDARSDQGCERCALLVYAGNKAPSSPWDFQKLDGPLGKTWQHYEASLTITGDVVVAIGTMNLDYGVPVKQIADIDNVKIVSRTMAIPGTTPGK